jgi:NAD(P)-dependent dehydrogenase (short-subunit alcohol dehydrogenase family)
VLDTRVLTGDKGFSAYAAAKGGLAGMTLSLAAEGKDDGVLVNGLLRGATTRGNVSVDAGYKRASNFERSPAMVAPARILPTRRWRYLGDQEEGGNTGNRWP